GAVSGNAVTVGEIAQSASAAGAPVLVTAAEPSGVDSGTPITILNGAVVSGSVSPGARAGGSIVLGQITSPGGHIIVHTGGDITVTGGSTFSTSVVSGNASAGSISLIGANIASSNSLGVSFAANAAGAGSAGNI